ncbi:NADAR domain-containing protein [Paraflavitalea speifideaquila]|uniref:NADAR domain-containing protein n=1 Tax=Paraflavitalea speifideaquila TaxID=3076558 RepID=UPI003313005E
MPGEGYTLVTEGSYYKFSQHAPMQAFLLRTGKKVIVEASPFDKIWGIGMAQSTKGPKIPCNGEEPIYWVSPSWRQGTN